MDVGPCGCDGVHWLNLVCELAQSGEPQAVFVFIRKSQAHEQCTNVEAHYISTLFMNFF